MKKYLIFAMFLVLAVALVSPVSVSAKTKAGTKPGSFFYFFDKVFEKADLFFTFNPEKKAKKALENAEERLAEAEESASENNQKAVETAMKDYQKNVEVLEKVLEKVPEQVKEAIEKVIEADKERQEEITKKIEEIKKETEEKINEIKKEESEFKNSKDEKLKSNDDVGDNESGKEEVENENKKDEQKKEIEKLKKEVEALKQKQIVPKQPTLEIQNSQEQKKSEEVRNNAEQTTKKIQAKIQRNEEDFVGLSAKKEDLTAKSQQPHLISFKDNLGNIYTEKKDFVRKASEPFNHGFGASYTPPCLQGISAINVDCQSEIVNWVNNRSIEIGKSLNITLDSFDANSDDVFYYISYGSRKDWGYGNMRVLQSWGTNKTFGFPIAEQLYNETLFENLNWGSTFFEAETRKYYDKNVKLNNAGELNIQVCFNDKAEKMVDSFGEQFPDGCILFKYFILKSGYSNLTTSTQPQ